MRLERVPSQRQSKTLRSSGGASLPKAPYASTELGYRVLAPVEPWHTAMPLGDHAQGNDIGRATILWQWGAMLVHAGGAFQAAAFALAPHATGRPGTSRSS